MTDLLITKAKSEYQYDMTLIIEMTLYSDGKSD